MLSPKDLARCNRARKHGIVHPIWTLKEARSAGISFALACAILMRESGGGHNVFGHDPTICVGWGTVTKAKYLNYRSRRRASGNRLMQGIGPMQLTYYTYQDKADRLGGCWRWRINVRVGFRALSSNIRRYGTFAGIRAYNGAGPAAEAYARAVTQSTAWWNTIVR